MEFVLALVIVVLVAWFVTAPLRDREPTERDDPASPSSPTSRRARPAKYRQIRDAETDRAAGKLTEEDYERLDRELRAEAIDILKRIDRLRPAPTKS